MDQVTQSLLASVKDSLPLLDLLMGVSDKTLEEHIQHLKVTDFSDIENDAYNWYKKEEEDVSDFVRREENRIIDDEKIIRDDYFKYRDEFDQDM